MYGIPNMKLEKQIVDRRIQFMRDEGISFITQADVGKNYDPKKLLSENDAVVLCCGAKKPRDLAVKNRGAKGVYLRWISSRRTPRAFWTPALRITSMSTPQGKNVVVVGGGDTGNDCVGTCIRHGCKSVVQLEMMPKAPDARTPDNPWPEWPRICKTDYGQQEAIAVFGADPRLYSTTATELLTDKDGALTGVKVVKLSPDLKPIAGTEQVLPCELLIIAAGFLGCQEYTAKAFGVTLTKRNVVETQPDAYATNVPGGIHGRRHAPRAIARCLGDRGRAPRRAGGG